MGRKTIRRWIRVECPACRGSGFREDYRECKACKGTGKVNRAVDVKPDKKKGGGR